MARKKKIKKVFVDRVGFISEDSGQAQIATIYDDENPEVKDGMFVRIQSWEDYVEGQPLKHEKAMQFEGKKVKITIEVVD